MVWLLYTTQLPGTEEACSLRRVIDRTGIIWLVTIPWAPAICQLPCSVRHIHFLISFSQPCSVVGLTVLIFQMSLREDKVTGQSKSLFLCDRVSQNPVLSDSEAQAVFTRDGAKYPWNVCPQDRDVCLLRTHPCPFEVNNNQHFFFFFFYHMSLGTTLRFRTPGCPEIWSYPVWDLSYSSVLWPHGLHKAQHQSSLPWIEF